MGWKTVNVETERIEDSNPAVWANAAMMSLKNGKIEMALDQIHKAVYYTGSNKSYINLRTSILITYCDYLYKNGCYDSCIYAVHREFYDAKHSSSPSKLYYILFKSYVQMRAYEDAIHCLCATIIYIPISLFK